MADEHNFSKSPSCSEPGDSDRSLVPFLLLAGTGAVAIATYTALRRQSTSDGRQGRSAVPESSAACALARAWLAVDPDPETRAEVSSWLTAHLEGTPPEEGGRSLLDALDASSARRRLHFGTAGLRAVVGAGYDRLNAVTVINFSFAATVVFRPQRRTVVIAYDARHSSRKFATLIAHVFVSKLAHVRLFSCPVPTPLAAFDAHSSEAIATLVVTASHNPPADNGIKVYGSDAIQLRPDDAARIETLMQRPVVSGLSFTMNDEEELSAQVEDPLAEARNSYVRTITDAIRMRLKDDNARAPPAVYTACHGVGYKFVGELFRAFGLPDVIPCKEQCEPDGDFPTLPFPNPEEPGALDLAIQTARRNGARIVLANDPDADRFAAAELAETEDGENNVRIFKGDEIATLLADYISTQLRKGEDSNDLSRYAVVTSTVSSKILASMARKRGFSFHESLTGFKWLNKAAVDLENDGKIVFLIYEEAIGFNITRNIVRDKDGISAAAVFYEMVGFLYDSGNTLTNRMRELLDECGVHLTNNGYLRLSPESPSIKVIFDCAREAGLPDRFGEAKVRSYRDLTEGIDTAEDDQKSRFPADSSSQFITFRCASEWSSKNDCPLIIHLRGSGTEPKIKYYSELRCTTDRANDGSAQKLLDEAVGDAIETILRPEVNKLIKR